MINIITPREQELRAANVDLCNEIKTLEAINKELLEALKEIANHYDTEVVLSRDIASTAIAHATKGEAK